MSAKAKAKYLRYKYFTLSEQLVSSMIDEKIKTLPSHLDGRHPHYQKITEFCKEYWKDVKNEYERLLK
jgi:hypothetical protein